MGKTERVQFFFKYKHCLSCYSEGGNGPVEKQQNAGLWN